MGQREPAGLMGQREPAGLRGQREPAGMKGQREPAGLREPREPGSTLQTTFIERILCKKSTNALYRQLHANLCSPFTSK